MDTKTISLKWSRPQTTEYPKIWSIFHATDLNGEKLIEYHIQDLPESRFEEAVQHMIANYLKDEPMTSVLMSQKLTAFEVAYFVFCTRIIARGVLDGSENEQHITDYTIGWRSILAQKTVLVCFKADSEEIVGLNFNFVNSEEDNFFQKYTDLLSCDSVITKTVFGVVTSAYANFDPFKHYGVTEFLGSFGLSVDRKYRGRGIGAQLLSARKAFCKEFGLNLTHTIFSSDFSNKNAEKVGFKTDVAISFQEIIKSHPEWPIGKISSKELTLKSWYFGKVN